MLVDTTIAWHFVNAGQEPVAGISGISLPLVRRPIHLRYRTPSQHQRHRTFETFSKGRVNDFVLTPEIVVVYDDSDWSVFSGLIANGLQIRNQFVEGHVDTRMPTHILRLNGLVLCTFHLKARLG